MEAPCEPTQGDVADALLHLARLAASHAGWGVTFIGANDAGPEPYPHDEKGLDTLTRVTKLLLQDRERMCRRAADVLVDALHAAVTTVYSEVRTSDEAEEHVEDLIEERAKEVGFALGRPQLKRFDVDRSYIKEHKGPAQAAAGAIVDAMDGQRKETSQGRSVFDAKARRAKQPPVAGPLNRYVPLRTIAHFLAHVLVEADAETARDILLPLEALRAGATEAILYRVETSFRQRMRDDLERGYETMTEFFLALLHGENRAADQYMTPEMEQQWAEVRAEFRWLATELMSLSDGVEAVLVQKAQEASRWWIAKFKSVLAID